MWKLDRELVLVNQIYKQYIAGNVYVLSAEKYSSESVISWHWPRSYSRCPLAPCELCWTLTMRIMLGLNLALEHAPKHIHRSSLIQEGYACSISSEEASLNHFQWTLSSHCNWSQAFLNIRHPSGDARWSEAMPSSLPYETLYGKQGIYFLHWSNKDTFENVVKLEKYCTLVWNSFHP